MRAVQFVAEAEEELQRASRIYEMRRKGLGREFLLEVRDLVSRIIQHPEASRSILPGVRKAGVRRFPYDLIYRVTPDRIEVIAVMHQRRAPGYWMERL